MDRICGPRGRPECNQIRDRRFTKFHRLASIIVDILHIGMTIVTLRSKKNNYALTAAMISLTLNIDSGFVISIQDCHNNKICFTS